MSKKRHRRNLAHKINTRMTKLENLQRRQMTALKRELIAAIVNSERHHA